MKGEGFGYRFPIRRSEAAIGMPIRGFGPSVSGVCPIRSGFDTAVNAFCGMIKHEAFRSANRWAERRSSEKNHKTRCATMNYEADL